MAKSSQGAIGQSKEFLDLIKSIGEARSRDEEDDIVIAEIETLKGRTNERDIPKRQMKEFIIRLVYIEMLGHDASFGYIHAVKMTHDDNLLVKRTGYLAVTLFLNEDHDLIFLIVNTIQKDLKSDNYLVVCAALNAVCRLIHEETVPAVLPQVVELLVHPKEVVRKKAVMALHRFHRRSPASISHLVSNLRKRLCDNDPGVMGAALYPLFDLITIDPNSYKDLVVTFVSILKQAVERRLPKTYDYHQMPAPFIQIKLLKILALLGSGDKHASAQMYTVVGDIIRKTEKLSNMGNAVLYESICCAAAIYHNSKLLEAAADAISRFLKSDNHNLKYMGIDALGRLVKISPEVAGQHQLAVIDCLEDPDDTLKRKTFELLYKMTKSSNVEVIVNRMIDYMISINDTHYKTEIASRCIELTEQFAPSNQWFIQTMYKVFEHAGNLVNIKVAQNLMRLIAEGFGENDEIANNLLRSSAVESYLQIVGEPKLPSVFLQVICWVLGEYGTADGKYSASYMTGKLCDVAEAYSSDDTVKGYAITAITKILAFEVAAGRKVDMLPECQSLLEELSASHSTDLQQRAYELKALVRLDARAARSIMPSDSSCEDIQVDKNLSFLDNYVKQSLEKGARPYIPEPKRSGMSSLSNLSGPGNHEALAHTLRFEAYETPKAPVRIETTPVPQTPSNEPESSYNTEIHQAPDSGSDGVTLKLDGVQKKWGRPSSSSPSSATDSSHNAVPSKERDASYESRKPKVEVSSEKQRLAASLFGVKPKNEIPLSSSSAHKPTKSSGRRVDKFRVASSVAKHNEVAPEKATLDLLDLGGPANVDVATPTPFDPFEQLEGILDAPSANPSGSAVEPDILGLYGEMPARGPSLSINNLSSMDNNLLYIGSSSAANKNALGGLVASQIPEKSTGPNPKDSMQMDALVRLGVTPLSQNPNLFNDLLG